MCGTSRRLFFALLALGLAACEEMNPNPRPGATSGEADAAAAGGGGDHAGGDLGGSGGDPAGGGGAGAGGAEPEGASWARGAALFHDNCELCHGAAGTGGRIWPNSIRNLPSIAAQVRNGGGGMPAFPALSDFDVRSIELFLADAAPPPGGGTGGAGGVPGGVGGAPGPAIDAGVAPGGPTAERGAEVFRLNCALCHGPDGSGGAIYPQSIRGRTGIADQVHHGGNGMPAFPLMSDVDIASVELFLAGAAPPPPDPDAGAGGAGGGMDAGAPGDPRVAAGAALFRQNCAICHGPDGSGGPVWARSIRNMTGIAVQVRNGGGGMPAFPAMTDEQITAIELFLSDAQAPPPADAGPPPPPPTGREVFALVCASCHGDDGEGTANGPQIESPVVGYATWVVRNGRARTRYPNPMVAYPEAAVSADQLTEILTWLRSFPKPQTGEGLYTRFCGNCHGPQGRGGRTEGIGGNLGDIRERVRRGHGGSNYASEYMPAWGPDELSDNDLALIAQYLSTFGRGGD